MIEGREPVIGSLFDVVVLSEAITTNPCEARCCTTGKYCPHHLLALELTTQSGSGQVPETHLSGRAPLLTLDAKLAATSCHHARIERL